MTMPILHLDILIPIALIAALVIIGLCFWIALRRRIADLHTEQESHADQLAILENKMSRIEGALFYGPSAQWTMENAPHQAKNPEDRQELVPDRGAGTTKSWK